MSTLDKLFKAQMAQIPVFFLSDLLREKFSEQGVEVSDEILKKFTDHIMAENNGILSIDDKKPDQNVKIKIDDTDIKELEDSIRNFLNTGTRELIESVSDKLAKSISKKLKSDWKKWMISAGQVCLKPF